MDCTAWRSVSAVVAPGRYSLTVGSYRHSTQSQEIEIAAGQQTEVAFVLEDSGDS